MDSPVELGSGARPDAVCVCIIGRWRSIALLIASDPSPGRNVFPAQRRVTAPGDLDAAIGNHGPDVLPLGGTVLPATQTNPLSADLKNDYKTVRDYVIRAVVYLRMKGLIPPSSEKAKPTAK